MDSSCRTREQLPQKKEKAPRGEGGRLLVMSSRLSPFGRFGWSASWIVAFLGTVLVGRPHASWRWRGADRSCLASQSEVTMPAAMIATSGTVVDGLDVRGRISRSITNVIAVFVIANDAGEFLS